MSRWHVKQTSCCGTRTLVLNGAISGFLILRSVSLSPCVLWQLVHETSFLRCLPLSQNARWRLASWQLRQIASFCAPVSCFEAGFTIPPTPRPPPAATCAVPSPWQLTQPPLAAGERGCAAAPCLVALKLSTYGSWQALQTSGPGGSARASDESSQPAVARRASIVNVSVFIWFSLIAMRSGAP